MSSTINMQRVAKNTILLYIRMFFVLIVTLYTSRVILKVLGVSDYGVFNVVAGAVALFGFMKNAMTMATQRFLNCEMPKNDIIHLRNVFNTALNIHVIVSLVVVLFAESFGLWLVCNVLNIPEGRLYAAKWVYQIVIINTFISIIQVPFNSVIIAHERMDFYAYISIIETVLKLGIVFLLIKLPGDKLIIYSFLLFLVHFLIFLAYYIYTTKHFQESKPKFVWDKGMLKEMSGFLGWNICGQVAQMLTTQGVNMVVNVFHGVLLNAAIAVTNQVNGAIHMFVANFQTSFRPQIMKSFAAQEYDGMRKLIYTSSKISFFLLYVISIPILFNIDLVLDVWLDNVPDYSAVFCTLLIWYSYLEAIGLPLVMAIMASGKNRDYQIFVSLAISLNLLLVWLFMRLGFSPQYIFYVKIAISFLVMAVRLFFAKRQAFIQPKDFISNTIFPIFFVLVLTQSVYYLMQEFLYKGSIVNKIGLTIILEIITVLSIYFLGTKKTEKNYLKSMILKKIKK